MIRKNRDSGDPTPPALPNLIPGPEAGSQDDLNPALADIDQATFPGKFLGERPQQEAQGVRNKAMILRKFFPQEDVQVSQTRTVLVNGKPESKCRFHERGETAARIPDKTSSFKLVANFNSCRSGHYVVRWRVKLLENFNIPNGLWFIVSVTHSAEADVSGTLDVTFPADSLKLLECNKWYDLMLDEKLVIHPHLGTARVEAALCNIENIDRLEYSGLVVEHVEIRSMARAPEENPDIVSVLVPKTITPKFTIDTARAHPSTQSPSSAPITRLASSRDNRFIASLALAQDTACITVWDVSVMRDLANPEGYLDSIYRRSATAVVIHSGIGDLPIGLALSANGNQVAIFQEPKIGEWADGSRVERASFPFHFFDNPLAPQPSVSVSIDPVQDSNGDVRDESPNGGKPPGQGSQTGVLISTLDTSPEPLQLEQVDWEHDHLKSFIGFATFLPESGTIEIFPTAKSNDTVEDGDDVAPTESEPLEPTYTFFVACSGMYLDVFRISPEKRWKRIHTITLKDLLPTLSRRITSKMMMESITNNTFMWLEDGGRSCTIWNLMTGSNITYISSIEGGRFRGPSYRGHSRMAISPRESIVALASVDGSLTTYFSNTGVAINNRKFPGYKIEHVAFHGQDDMLFVMLRNSITYELSPRILDSFQLKYEVVSAPVPIPTIGTTLLTFFDVTGSWNTGVICEPNGDKINFYPSYQQTVSKLNKNSINVIKSDAKDVVFESSLNEDIQYRLRTGIHNDLLPEGDGALYWVLRVEVVEENLITGIHRIITSFVPEPWMRVKTSDAVHPEKLQSAFFVPCGTRFAVVGMQTLQIWNLPTVEGGKCSLQFIWSQPREGTDLMNGGIAYKSSRVQDYYLNILGASIYMDTETGNTTAEIKMNDKSNKRIVCLPGPRTMSARNAILHCFRSIHLLAAAYVFSFNEESKTTREASQWTFTFGDHAEAIVRFAREHINRMIPKSIFSSWRQDAPHHGMRKPRLKGRAKRRRKKQAAMAAMAANNDMPVVALDAVQPLPDGSASKPPADGRHNLHDIIAKIDDDSDSSSDEEIGGGHFQDEKDVDRPDVVTLLTLLLERPYLQRTNEVFMQSLLASPRGEWIPRESKYPNPIKHVIEARNGNLVGMFIDYCIRNAKSHHPAYMMPVIQSLNQLSDRYPGLLAEMFRKTSYVPVHNARYVASHAVVANSQRAKWLWSKLTFRKFDKSNNINDYVKPVFSLRSQLPFRTAGILRALGMRSSVQDTVRDKREDTFPAKLEGEDEKKKASPYSYKIYVAPFPKFSMYGKSRSWFKDRNASKSAFTDIAGQDCFDSPAMVATLEYKWHKFGFSYWVMRFMVVLCFFILMLIITSKQIQTASLQENLDAPPGDDALQFTHPSEIDIISRYLMGWRPLFKVSIVLGFALIVYELMQFYDSPKKYIRSPYNYLDLAACITPVVGCFLFLNTAPKSHESEGIDHGPEEIWVMSFSILFLYMNILFELRVIKHLGIVVNIILNITKRIAWFMLIFLLFLVGFTHALLHLLHTRDYCLQGDTDCQPDGDFPDAYPTNFFKALFASYFFLVSDLCPNLRFTLCYILMNA
ncbi:hypothetical protein B0O80DRAFT_109389 [Mortierella sp. GBAus27b]|nr:hypothetical protein B0O80DRAFT_109389 [Mortierella sp. GBAus27b]